MQHSRRTNQRRTCGRLTRLPGAVPAAAVAALAAGTFLVTSALPPDATAQERPKIEPEAPEPADRVRRLLDDVMSDSPAARERAEKEIVALGEPARAELERLTRDPDPKRAMAALKLLQSDKWAERERRAAREKEERGPGVRLPEIDLRGFQEQVERQMEEMRRRMAEWEKEIDWDAWMPELDSSAPLPAGGRSSGTVIENGNQFAWTIDETGKVRVTVREGKDAAEKVYEAPSVEALRKEHPEIATRLDGYAPQGRSHRFVFRWPRGTRDEAAEKAAPQGQESEETSPRDPNRPQLRNGEERLKSQPGAGDPLTPPAPGTPVTGGPRLGITTGPVPDVLREQLDLPEGGIVVESVVPGTLAEKLGLRRNDVLLRVAGRDVAGPLDVRKALEGVAEGGAVEVEFVRKGRREKLTATR